MIKEKLYSLWKNIYPGEVDVFSELMDNILQWKEDFQSHSFHLDPQWFQNAVVYSLYVDLFSEDFQGLKSRINYFIDLGVDTLWLLPILKSPGRDYGFDVEDYFQISNQLLDKRLKSPSQSIFQEFLDTAHTAGLKIIFDIPLNHCSEKHEFFQKALSEPESHFRNYFIWHDNQDKYKDCRIIFKGLVDSNWQFEPESNQYYFHRFYDFQPDWNFRNPEVLAYMIKVLSYWKLKGVDGFRLDAIPYLWKEEHSECENLPTTHTIIQLFRAVMDYICPGTLLLAEACQPPAEVVNYFGVGNEVQGAYHFPLMPQIFNSLARQSYLPIKQILNKNVTPPIPEGCSWFVFLRCHDELTLEMVSSEDRKFLFDSFCHKNEWGFREGEGISARLADLFENNEHRINLATSVLLTISGTPVLYYGDEFAMNNDSDFFEKASKISGYRDSRHLVRGPVNWKWVEQMLNDSNSLTYKVFHQLRSQLQLRKTLALIGEPEFVEMNEQSLLAYQRVSQNGEKYLFIHNLKNDRQKIEFPVESLTLLLANHSAYEQGYIGPWQSYWFKY